VELFDGFDSNYRYILVAARRARQLQSGARAKVEARSQQPCRIAELEVRAKKVDWFIPAAKEAPEQPVEAPHSGTEPEE
jgi:DNA-directed RNA polymerase subunit omega